MEKEKKLSQPAQPVPDPEFLRSMELLEKMEMLRMMREFQLDEGAKDTSPMEKKVATPGEGSKR